MFSISLRSKLIFRFFFSMAFLLTAASAQALSDAEVRQSYNGCVKFMKLKPAQQKALARKTQYSYQQVLWGCRLLIKQGLAKDIALEHEYQRCRNGGCSSHAGGGNSSDEPRRCVSSVQCSGGQNCLNDTCQEVNGSNHCDAGGLACTSGETCTNGQCH